MLLLTYSKWQDFHKVIQAAIEVYRNSGGEDADAIFMAKRKDSPNASKKYPQLDYELTRHACYLVVLSSDGSKPAVALGKTYFAITTEQYEQLQQAEEDRLRVELREKLKQHHLELSARAHQAGIRTAQQYAHFYNAGHRGLYRETAPQILARRGLQAGQDFYNFMGSLETAANDFRATLALTLLNMRRVADVLLSWVSEREKGNETMTLLTAFGITSTHRGNAVAPHELAPSDLTMVVPVKNNQIGVTRLLESCLRVFAPNHFPAETLLVDNLSHPPVEVPTHLASSLPVRLLICAKPGAAAARNLGARQAQTPWILFLDSNCLLTPGLIDGYRQAMNGAIAYAGMVQAERSDRVSRYYDTQRILMPPPLWDNGMERPAYLITANALVWRAALAEIGGFDERFPSAAGEDIDLGLRLWSVGPLSYAPVAQVLHTFEPKLCAFLRRFVRYGRGNRRLAARYQVDLAPSPFVPHTLSPINWLLASMQFLALWWGYHTTRPVRGWSIPLSTVAWSTTPLEVVPTIMEQPPLENLSEVSI